ncbi:MAG: DUF4279 domain-containing protein [Silicimonas sp.]|nr:DUF4279 domain-containing protein [Silicimonas sp.]
MNSDISYFEVQLLIRHPKIDPDDITQILGLEPSRSWMVGDRRSTPSGEKLEGNYDQTSWSHGWQHAGDRFFFRFAESVLEDLKANSEFFLNMASEGGVTMLNIQLFGGQNVGDLASQRFLGMLTDLKIQLGTEVFPEWNSAEDALSVPTG